MIRIMSVRTVGARRVVCAAALLLVTLATATGVADADGARPAPKLDRRAAAGPSVTITGVNVDPLRRIVQLGFQAASPGTATAFRCSVQPAGLPVHYARCSSPSIYRHLTAGNDTISIEALSGKVTDPPARASVRVPIEFAPCWGAAARDPLVPCVNPALDRIVHPTPDDALLMPPDYCRNTVTVDAANEVEACTFGRDPGPGVPGVALIGDSHSDAMGSGVTYVADAEGWSGVRLRHLGCGFSTAVQNDRPSNQCVNWTNGVTAWLDAHPEVQTVFITASDSWTYATSAESGFQSAWAALPASVTSIYVIRDTPKQTLGEQNCVSAALAAHRTNIGTRCAVARAKVLQPDAEARAAATSWMARVHLIDLSPFFCGTRCFPVIGGALVDVDEQHVSQEFSASLGPYIQRAMGAG